MLRERISKLSAASVRISVSLDLDTVLSEVVESARALIGESSMRRTRGHPLRRGRARSC